ncbi:hypothetical protein P3S68_023331 [Capsicum galapagoense]
MCIFRYTSFAMLGVVRTWIFRYKSFVVLGVVRTCIFSPTQGIESKSQWTRPALHGKKEKWINA